MVRRLALALLLALGAVAPATAHAPTTRLTVHGQGTFAFELPRAATVDLAESTISWHGNAVWGFWIERADRAPGTPYGGRAVIGDELVSMSPREVLSLPRGRYVVTTWGDRTVMVSVALRGVSHVRATRVATRPVVVGNAHGDQLLLSGRMAVTMGHDRPARAAFLRLYDDSRGWLAPGTAAISVPGRHGRRTVATAPTGQGSATLSTTVWPEMLAATAFEPVFSLEGEAVQGAVGTFAIVVT